MIVLALILAVAATSDGGVWGVWKTPDNDLVRIGPCGPSTCGWLQESDDFKETPDLRDLNNPDPGLRSRALKGLRIFSGFTAENNGSRWEGGRIYDPDEGKTYTADLTLIGHDRLKVSGCIIKPLCRTQIWTRDARK